MNRQPWPAQQPRGLLQRKLSDSAVDENPHRRSVFLSLCTCEAIGSWPSLLRCWRCASGTSCSQRARQIPLKRTVFRHAKLSKSFRESFDLAGKLLDTAERLLGDLDPKFPMGLLIARGQARLDGAVSATLRPSDGARRRRCRSGFPAREWFRCRSAGALWRGGYLRCRRSRLHRRDRSVRPRMGAWGSCKVWRIGGHPGRTLGPACWARFAVAIRDFVHGECENGRMLRKVGQGDSAATLEMASFLRRTDTCAGLFRFLIGDRTRSSS
jgi:hypothetical protein